MASAVKTSVLGALATVGCLAVVGAAHAQVGGVNPYTPIGQGSPYVPNPYLPNPNVGPYSRYNYPYSYFSDSNPGSGIGDALFGQADVMRAYGTLINNYEQARILRQQSIQAKFDTQRKRFELEMYIKANTPTFTEDQAKIAQTTLKRIRSNSTQAEIASGKSLNFMLDDVVRFTNRKVPTDNLPLSENVLMQLNVTTNTLGIGLLRNEGKLSWPVGLLDVVPAEQRKIIDTQAQALMQGAIKGKVDPNVLRDFSSEVDRLSDSVVKKLNELGPNYLEAKRFASDLKDARLALERGEAPYQAQYMKWASSGTGRTVQDVVDFMISKGLRFAPATGADEAAYRAFYSAFVAFDVALNAQGGAATDTKEP
jgi:hypothetical protein